MNDPKESRHASGLSEAEAWHWYTRYPSLLAKVLLYGLAVVAVYLALSAIESALFPVLLSLLVAYLLDPTVDWFESKGISRSVAIGIIMLVAFGGIGILILFLYPTIAHLVTTVVEGVPRLLTSARTDLIPWVEANLGVEVPASASDAMAEYGDTLTSQVPSITSAVSAAVTGVVTKLGSVFSSIVNLVMIPVFTFYFLRDFDRLKESATEYLPAANREFLLSRARRVDAVVGAWFRGQCEVALILAGLYAVGLSLVFGLSGVGVTAGIAVGVLAGLLNVIPYFGFLIGFVLSMLLVLLEWNGVWPIVGVIAVFILVQTLEGYVITPRVVGEKVGLSPVVVIIALLVGGELMGLMGVLLALPIAGGLRVLLPDAVAYYRSSPTFTGKVAKDGPRTFVEIALAADRAREEAEAAVAASAVAVAVEAVAVAVEADAHDVVEASEPSEE